MQAETLKNSGFQTVDHDPREGGDIHYQVKISINKGVRITTPLIPVCITLCQSALPRLTCRTAFSSMAGNGTRERLQLVQNEMDRPEGTGKKSVAQGQSGALTLTSTLVWGQLIPGVTAALVAAQGVQAPLLTAPAVGPGALIHLYGEESDVTNHGPNFAPPSSSQSLRIPVSLPHTAGESPLKTSLVHSARSYPQIPMAAENPQGISHNSFQAFRLAGSYHQRLCTSPHPRTVLSFLLHSLCDI